jgi:hypothetical protein
VPPGRPITAVDIPNSYILDSNGAIYIPPANGPGAPIGDPYYIKHSMDTVLSQGGVEVWNDGELFILITNFSPGYPSDTFAKVDVDNGHLMFTPTYQTVHVPGGGAVYAGFYYTATAAGTFSVTATVGNATATFNMVVASATQGGITSGGG